MGVKKQRVWGGGAREGKGFNTIDSKTSTHISEDVHGYWGGYQFSFPSRMSGTAEIISEHNITHPTL